MRRPRQPPPHPVLLARWLAGGRAAKGAGFPRRGTRVQYGPLAIRPRSVSRFLDATWGEDLTFLSQGMLPPTYPALWETAAALEILRRAGAPPPFAGLIHLESERLMLRPLRLDAEVRLAGEIEAVEPHARGRRVTILSRVLGRGGRLCAESRFVLLLRGDGTGPAESRREDAEPLEGWRTITSWRLPAAHGRRYARASGDFNPVHLWGWSARLFGYSAPILHGFCLEAMAAHALLRARLGGDPTGLTRLAIRFHAPVLLPAALRLEVADAAVGRFRVCAQGGGKVLAAGEWAGERRSAAGGEGSV